MTENVSLIADRVNLRIVATTAVVARFGFIFQEGFFYACDVGRSLEDFLIRQLGLSQEFLDERVSTIFLDGRCVDDLTSAVIRNGSVVALSSGLPGLAGATLRRAGPYASMREAISHHVGKEVTAQGQGEITVKLFNLLMVFLGPVFLGRGIEVEGRIFGLFLRSAGSSLVKLVKQVYLNGQDTGPDVLRDDGMFSCYRRIGVVVNIKSHRPG